MLRNTTCNLKDSVLEKNSYSFSYGFKYDHHFIIKELTEELKKQFTSLVENTEKYLRVLIEK